MCATPHQPRPGSLELELLQNYVRDGDAAAIQLLIRLHHPMVFATCRRYLHCEADAEDALQEVFLTFMANAAAIKSNVGAWLFRCAKNTALSMIRSRRSRRSRETERSRLTALENHDLDAPRRERLSLLEDCLAQLDASDRSLLLQNCVSGVTQREIALSLGISQQAVAKRIGKALTRVRRAFSSQTGAAAIAGPALLLVKRAASAALPQGLRTSWAAWTAATPATIKVGVAVTVMVTATVVTYESSASLTHPTPPHQFGRPIARSTSPAFSIPGGTPAASANRTPLAAGPLFLAPPSAAFAMAAPASPRSASPSHPPLRTPAQDRPSEEPTRLPDLSPNLPLPPPLPSNSQFAFLTGTPLKGPAVRRPAAASSAAAAKPAVAAADARDPDDPVSADTPDATLAAAALASDASAPVLLPDTAADTPDAASAPAANPPANPASDDRPHALRQDSASFWQSPRDHAVTAAPAFGAVAAGRPSAPPFSDAALLPTLRQNPWSTGAALTPGAADAAAASDLSTETAEAIRLPSLALSLAASALSAHAVSNDDAGPSFLASLAGTQNTYLASPALTTTASSGNSAPALALGAALDSRTAFAMGPAGLIHANLYDDPISDSSLTSTTDSDPLPADAYAPRTAGNTPSSPGALASLFALPRAPILPISRAWDAPDFYISGTSLAAVPEPASLALLLPLVLWALLPRRTPAAQRMP